MKHGQFRIFVDSQCSWIDRPFACCLFLLYRRNFLFAELLFLFFIFSIFWISFNHFIEPIIVRIVQLNQIISFSIISRIELWIGKWIFAISFSQQLLKKQIGRGLAFAQFIFLLFILWKLKSDHAFFIVLFSLFRLLDFHWFFENFHFFPVFVTNWF